MLSVLYVCFDDDGDGGGDKVFPVSLFLSVKPFSTVKKRRVNF